MGCFSFFILKYNDTTKSTNGEKVHIIITYHVRVQKYVARSKNNDNNYHGKLSKVSANNNKIIMMDHTDK